MENLFQHIERLLAYHDYVIVPELGGFVVQNESAVVLPDRILPPRATVGFNSLMHHADGLLALEMARAEGITYRQAVELVQREVASIKQQFNKDDFFKFGNIGFFRRTEEDALSFSPIANVAFLPANSFRTDIYIPEKSVNVVKPVKRLSIVPTLRYAAAVALLLGLSMFMPQQSTDIVPQTASLLNFNSLKLPEIEILPENTVSVEVPVETQELAIENKNTGSFEVIVECLSIQQSAEKYCNTLKNKGFIYTRIIPSKKLHMISLQNFETKEEAQNYMREVRKLDPKFKNAWVLCK